MYPRGTWRPDWEVDDTGGPHSKEGCLECAGPAATCDLISAYPPHGGAFAQVQKAPYG